MQISTNDFKTGLKVLYNNAVWEVVEFQHVKPGKGQAFVKTRLKNMATGQVLGVIFGDGAGAAVIQPVEDGRGLLAARIQSDGDYVDYLYTPGGGTRYPASIETVTNRLHYIKMRGNELFKVAVRSMEEISRQVLDDLRMSPSDIDLFIPHQANQRITEAVAERLGLPPEKVYSNIHRVGNTSSASIPIALDECVRSGRVKPGDLLMMASFGAGVTFGAAILRW